MKLRRKLLSAGFALGATALTLTTSTFAWYTQNDVVDAHAVSGMTSTSVDASSLYIAAASAYNGSAQGAAATNFTKYGPEATPTVISSAAVELQPVAYGKVGDATVDTYNFITSAGANVAVASDVAKAPIYEYVLRFQIPNNSADTPVYVSAFSLTNPVDANTIASTATSAEIPGSKQMALVNNQDLGLTDTTAEGYAASQVGVSVADFYNVDLLHSLKMTVTATPVRFTAGASAGSAGTYTLVTDEADTKIYDLDSFADTSKDVNVGTANAVAYYNTVLNRTISKPSQYLSGATAIAVANAASSDNAAKSTLFTITDDYSYMEVRFVFWLDGWDEYCYDVCRRQQFSVSMQFSTSASKSILQ